MSEKERRGKEMKRGKEDAGEEGRRWRRDEKEELRRNEETMTGDVEEKVKKGYIMED